MTFPLGLRNKTWGMWTKYSQRLRQLYGPCVSAIVSLLEQAGSELNFSLTVRR